MFEFGTVSSSTNRMSKRMMTPTQIKDWLGLSMVEGRSMLRQ